MLLFKNIPNKKQSPAYSGLQIWRIWAQFLLLHSGFETEQENLLLTRRKHEGPTMLIFTGAEVEKLRQYFLRQARGV